MILHNPTGITVKELKDFVKDLPEVDPVSGDPCEVWLEIDDKGSNPVDTISHLNFRTSEDGQSFSDVLISRRK